MANTRIDHAVRRCVRSAMCGPKTPLAALATAIDELRDDPSWDECEIEQVQAKAYRRLSRPTQYSLAGIGASVRARYRQNVAWDAGSRIPCPSGWQPHIAAYGSGYPASWEATKWRRMCIYLWLWAWAWR